MVAAFCRLVAFVLTLMPLYVFGEFLDDDLYYGFESGSSQDSSVYVYGRNKSATHITIPSTVVWEYHDYNDCDDDGNARLKHRTCMVTRITNGAFQNYSSLTSVTIGSSVTNIGERTFENCSSLTSVTIPSSVTSIGSSAFSYCSSLASVTIPSSVTSIGRSAFYSCSSLASVTIPSSVTSIGSSAFSYCSSLASVTIGSGVTSIGGSAFSGCSSLTSVTIPNSVTSIGGSAFQNCSSLTSVWIGVSVESIGSSAFYGCSSLEGVMIPESVTNIHYTAFNLCENLQRFIVDQDNPAYASPDGTLCSKDLKTLVVYPRGRVDARLPDSLTTAMPDAFAGCNKLWMQWCKRINTIPYDLTQTPGDRAIADVTVNGDMALDAFVLKEGKVYDSVLYVHNYADHAVKVTLPSMPQTEYKTFKGATPLTLPAYSTSILTITRVVGGNAGGNVFLVSREELETVK